jgi:Leucine-rich repeat (LRR) protein
VNNNEIVYFDDSLSRIDYGNKNWDLSLLRLTYLSISNNKLTSLRFISKFPLLVEFYCSFNQLKNIRDIYHLKSLQSLAILDLWCNPMCTDTKYRLFIIYHLKLLKSLDGSTIDPSELTEAKELFGGKLTCDFIAEKFFHSKFHEIKMLEFPHSGIRIVDLSPSATNLSLEQFDNLRSLNLENNNLTSFSGIVYLKHLKVLCLNNNKIECILPKSKTNNNINNSNGNNNQMTSLGIDHILPSLEVLYLAYNGISDLVACQVGRLTSLKALFLQGFNSNTFY